MPILRFIVFTYHTTSVRPTIVYLACLALVALFSMALLEIFVLVLGAHGIYPTADVAEWLIRLKTATGNLLNGI